MVELILLLVLDVMKRCMGFALPMSLLEIQQQSMMLMSILTKLLDKATSRFDVLINIPIPSSLKYCVHVFH
jgi:hypothetical protein